ncbi:hypothetical protein [Anaeroarcus burkinensis]|nr:hypothetical protein [Anaeroarcus burkinensis]
MVYSSASLRESPGSQQQTLRKQRMKKPVDKAGAMWHNKPRCR